MYDLPLSIHPSVRPSVRKFVTKVEKWGIRVLWTHFWFLEAKASKGIHHVCIEKSPDRHLFIHPR